MFILTLFLKEDGEASVTRTPKSMIPFSPPAAAGGVSVGHVRELWPLFPHCEQLRDIFLATEAVQMIDRERERERERNTKVKKRQKLFR